MLPEGLKNWFKNQNSQNNGGSSHKTLWNIVVYYYNGYTNTA